MLVRWEGGMHDVFHVAANMRSDTPLGKTKKRRIAHETSPRDPASTMFVLGVQVPCRHFLLEWFASSRSWLLILFQRLVARSCVRVRVCEREPVCICSNSKHQ